MVPNTTPFQELFVCLLISKSSLFYSPKKISLIASRFSFKFWLVPFPATRKSVIFWPGDCILSNWTCRRNSMTSEMYFCAPCCRRWLKMLLVGSNGRLTISRKSPSSTAHRRRIKNRKIARTWPDSSKAIESRLVPRNTFLHLLQGYMHVSRYFCRGRE